MREAAQSKRSHISLLACTELGELTDKGNAECLLSNRKAKGPIWQYVRLIFKGYLITLLREKDYLTEKVRGGEVCSVSPAALCLTASTWSLLPPTNRTSP